MEDMVLDLQEKESCDRASEDMQVVIQLAADMGGIGFIENDNAHSLQAKRIDQYSHVDGCA